ncbi:hypothetical protein FG386_001231 [Cryptosporidium ryanae]|uniref:uncharacterized protein n=1 Tax=Cryptosporidium ryanae TaxID=515981 RepID=UPI00351AAB87|nr:hypothetical protein FG386_001231 [Cryptosporidium ryanae]
MSRFCSEEFLERIIPLSEKLDNLLIESLPESVSWNDNTKEYLINKTGIVKFSRELLKLGPPRGDLIKSALLVIVSACSKDKTDSEWSIQDQKILIFIVGNLELVKTGQNDIIFWLDIVFETLGLLKKNGLISLSKWICTCFEMFDWSITNPNVPFLDKTGLSREGDSITNNQIGDNLNQSPSTAVQRQLAQAKFVGLLKAFNRRLLGYGNYKEAGTLKSFVYSILPSNQAGICRKAFTPKGYIDINIKESVKKIFEVYNNSSKEETNSDTNTEKEEGEMVCEREESNKKKSDLRRIIESSRFVECIFDSYLRVDHFFQAPYEFLASVEGDGLSCNKTEKVDEISKDIEAIIMYFEEYKTIDYFNIKTNKKKEYLSKYQYIFSPDSRPDFHFTSLESKLEGIPSAFDFSYFRYNFVYRLSFLVCNYFSLVNDNLKGTNDYILNKLIPLLKRCLALLEKHSMEERFSIVRFINHMLKYELFWLFWKGNNCVDSEANLDNIESTIKSDYGPVSTINNEAKKRKIEEKTKTTKYISQKVFDKYINFVERIHIPGCFSEENKLQKEDIYYIRNIKKPDFSKERESLFLEPVNYDEYINKSVNKKMLSKFNDYKEKMLIDLDPDNGIEESEKSIKNTLFKWRCDRLFKRFRLEDLNSLDLSKLSQNDLEDSICKLRNGSENKEFDNTGSDQDVEMYKIQVNEKSIENNRTEIEFLRLYNERK